ncbi:RpiB/LacA/LacB family sugar-phosphate isomerase [Saccharothrix sp. NRRL B-16348]|uniref:RpiB/LacA/LacB family sugar-phosphate isomerase n=1 Tax=Saccharothrix sp. NRRL B-16348 TaxID=1415542 RepID=UPI0009EC0DEE
MFINNAATKKPENLLVGSDIVGTELADVLCESLRASFLVTRLPTPADGNYAVIARRLGKSVAEASGIRGLLVCGTGIGVCIAVNRLSGVRAAVCHDIISVRLSVLSNDCQVLCFGSRIIAPYSAIELAREWLSLRFNPAGSNKSAWKVRQIDETGV